MLDTTGQLAVAGLFFLHGAALSRDAIRDGATHWRLHLLILALTFGVFPLTVLPIWALAPGRPAGIVLQLLLPFALGQVLRPWLGGWLDRHARWTAKYDQAVILYNQLQIITGAFIARRYAKITPPEQAFAH